MIITDDKKKQWCVNPRKIDMAGIGNRQKPGGEQLVGFCLTLAIGQMQMMIGVFETIETAQLALDAVLAEMEKETPEDRAYRTEAALSHAQMEDLRKLEERRAGREELKADYAEWLSETEADYDAEVAELKEGHRVESGKKNNLLCESREEAAEYANNAVYRKRHPWRNLFRLKEKI